MAKSKKKYNTNIQICVNKNYLSNTLHNYKQPLSLYTFYS